MEYENSEEKAQCSNLKGELSILHVSVSSNYVEDT